MLLIPGLLLLVFTNVNAQGSKKPLPKDLEGVFQELMKIHNEKVVWDEDLAYEALDILMRGYSKEFAYYDMTITAREYFSKNDKSTLEEKLRYTLTYTFQGRQPELHRLPNGTQYGCDGIFVTYTRYSLMFTLCVFKSSGKNLPATMRKTFEKLNNAYNKGLEWSEDLASEALLESKSRSTESPYLVLREKRLFQKSDPRSLDEKVLITLTSCFSREGYKVRRLPNGTQYGCDGIFNTKREYRNLMSIVCIYDKH